jgi:glycosyltransferase involved in cell wall biosynthesis
MINFICQPTAEHFALPYLKEIQHQRHITRNLSEINQVLRNPGLTWIEWGNHLCKEILKKQHTSKIVVRIHDWEVRKNFVQTINWKNADCVWFINEQTQKDFYDKTKSKVESFVLPNAIDVMKFEISPKRRFNKHLCALSVGFDKRKRYDRLIEMFKLVHNVDPDYFLTIKAPVVNKEHRAEFIKCSELAEDLPVKFLTQPFNIENINGKGDVNDFFADKDYICSTSEHEAFHYAIGEGMLCGLVPVVYEWEWGGASKFWANVHKDIEGMALSIINGGIPSQEEQEGQRYFVEDNFGSKNLSKKLLEKIGAI